MLIESKFVIDNSERILRLLENGDATLTTMSEKLNINYYSVRKACRYLEDQGLVKPVPGQYRNVHFTIAPKNTSTNVIPNLQAVTGVYKLTGLLNSYKQNGGKGAVAIFNLPKHVVRIFQHAKAAADNKNVEVGLSILRADMERDHEAAKQIASFYEQILSNPIIWNAGYLARFPSDPSFDENDYQAAFNYFFKEETDA